MRYLVLLRINLGGLYWTYDIIPLSNCIKINWLGCTISKSKSMMRILSCPSFHRRGQLKCINFSFHPSAFNCHQSYSWVFGYTQSKTASLSKSSPNMLLFFRVHNFFVQMFKITEHSMLVKSMIQGYTHIIWAIVKYLVFFQYRIEQLNLKWRAHRSLK